MIVWDLFGLIYTLERFATRTWELYNKNNSLARDLYLVTLMIHWGVILENEGKFLKRLLDQMFLWRRIQRWSTKIYRMVR